MATVANKKALSVTLVDRVPRFDSHCSPEFDWFVVLTSRLDTYMAIFVANDNDKNNNNNDDTTGYFSPHASCW